MRTTIDSAGRLVIPRAMRERVGLLGPAEVDIDVDGAGIRIEAIADGSLVEEDGRLVIPATGSVVTRDMVQGLRDADQR